MTLAHHKTVEGARLALARGEISEESHRAVITRRLTLAEAKKRGPEGSRMLPEEKGFEDLTGLMCELGSRQTLLAYRRAFGGGE